MKSGWQPGEGCVLKRAPSGELHERLSLLCPDRGLIRCLRRCSTRAHTSAATPDLFDLARFQLERSRQGGELWFLAEYEVIQRHSGIGRSYAALQCASEYTRIIESNAEHLEDPEQLYRELVISLQAFDRGLRPDLVLLKALYRYARSEGYAVREQWYAGLHSSMQATVGEALFNGIETVSVAESSVHPMIDNLCHFLRRHTDIRC